MISVIIPVYNASRYLSRVITSIELQTFSNWELILVNDGSTDDSFSVCLDYATKDDRIIVLNQQNGGASSARNYGLEHAKGDLICFVDADDYVSSSYLEELFHDFLRDDSIDLVIQGFTKVRKSKITEYNLPIDITLCSLEDLFVNTNIFTFCGPCCKLFRISIIRGENVYFNPDVICAEDYDFLLRYLLKCRKVRLSLSNNYYYEEHAGSVSSHLHDYLSEYSSLMHLNSSFYKIHQFKDKKDIYKQYCYIISYFVYRVLSSLMSHPSSFKKDIMMMRQLSAQFGQLFKYNFFPETKMFSLGKKLFDKKQFLILYFYFMVIRRIKL